MACSHLSCPSNECLGNCLFIDLVKNTKLTDFLKTTKIVIWKKHQNSGFDVNFQKSAFLKSRTFVFVSYITIIPA